MPNRLLAGILALAMPLASVAVTPTDAHAKGVSVEEATAAQKQAAQAKYLEGTKSFTDGKFDEAYRAFKASYDVVASPNSHLMMGRALKEQGKFVEAFNTLSAAKQGADAAAKSDPKYQETADKVTEVLEQVRLEVALITFDVIGGEAGGGAGAVKLDGVDVPRTEWKTPRAVTSGKHTVEGSFAGEVRNAFEVDLRGGSERSIAVDVRGNDPGELATPVAVQDKPGEDEDIKEEWARDSRTSLLPAALVTGGVGVAGMGVFAVFGLLNQSKFDDLESGCANNVCPADRQDDIDTGEMYQTVANVGLVVGAVGLALGVTLLTIELASAPSEEKAASRGSSMGARSTLTLSTGAGPSSSWASVSGKF